MAKEREEAGNGESFVAVAEDFKVDCMSVEEIGEKGDCRVYGDHEEDADDAALQVSWLFMSNNEGTYCFCSHGFR